MKTYASLCLAPLIIFLNACDPAANAQHSDLSAAEGSSSALQPGTVVTLNQDLEFEAIVGEMPDGQYHVEGGRGHTSYIYDNYKNVECELFLRLNAPTSSVYKPVIYGPVEKEPVANIAKRNAKLKISKDSEFEIHGSRSNFSSNHRDKSKLKFFNFSATGDDDTYLFMRCEVTATDPDWFDNGISSNLDDLAKIFSVVSLPQDPDAAAERLRKKSIEITHNYYLKVAVEKFGFTQPFPSKWPSLVLSGDGRPFIVDKDSFSHSLSSALLSVTLLSNGVILLDNKPTTSSEIVAIVRDYDQLLKDSGRPDLQRILRVNFAAMHENLTKKRSLQHAGNYWHFLYRGHLDGKMPPPPPPGSDVPDSSYDQYRLKYYIVTTEGKLQQSTKEFVRQRREQREQPIVFDSLQVSTGPAAVRTPAWQLQGYTLVTDKWPNIVAKDEKIFYLDIYGNAQRLFMDREKRVYYYGKRGYFVESVDQYIKSFYQSFNMDPFG